MYVKIMAEMSGEFRGLRKNDCSEHSKSNGQEKKTFGKAQDSTEGKKDIVKK